MGDTKRSRPADGLGGGVAPEPLNGETVVCACGCERALPAGFGFDHRVVDILRNLYPAQLAFVMDDGKNRLRTGRPEDERELKLRIPRGL